MHQKDRQNEPVRQAYGLRNRRAEWRQRWFFLDRSTDEEEYRRIRTDALDHKRRLIAKKKDLVGHLAGYSPAGAGTPWFSVGPRNINGRVKSIAVHPTDPDIVYAGAASGGVWKSTDACQSWRALWNEQDTMAVGSVAIAPSAPDTVYVGTGEWTPGWSPSFPGTGLFVSTDGGSTWTQHTSLASRRVARVLVSPGDANRVYVAGDSGFERSTDGGATWTTIQAGEISDAVLDPADANTLYINVRNDGIYKSTNGGDDWNKLGAGPTGADADWVRLAIVDSVANGGDFLVAKRSGTLRTSNDGGTTWITLSGSHGGASFHAWCNLVAVAPDDEDIMLAGGSTQFQRTTNGGTSWSTLSGMHADHHRAVFARSNTDIVYECNDGGVYRSTDKGATWKKVSHGLVVTQFYDIGNWTTVGTVMGGGTQDQGTNMSTGGLTWKNIFGWDGGYFVLHPSDPRTIYAEHQNTDIHKSTDGGVSWASKTSGITGSNPWTGVITIDPNNGDKLYTGTQRVFRTTDGTATAWNASSQLLGGDVTAIAIAESDSNRVYAATSSGGVFRSDDGGVTDPWADKGAGLPGRACTDVWVDHGDRDRAAICFGGTNAGAAANSVWITTDGGDSWSDISSDLPNITASAVVLDPNDANTLYVGTDMGVYRTTDLGVSWHAFDNGIPNVIVTDLQLDRAANLLIAATFGRGMYKISISGAAEPTVDLYLRDSVLDTGERFPSPSNQPHPNDVSDQVYWWESCDIKVDVAPLYTPDALFDGVEFDELVHEDPKRTETNRFYLQVHNRGWEDATDVRVRAYLADASAGLAALPNALSPPDFNLSSTIDWTPVGPAQTISLLEPNRPVIVSWDYTVPGTAATHSCLLAVVSCAQDPITTTETNVNLLVKAEKRVCLKNLHVVNGAGPKPAQTLATINFHNVNEVADLIDIAIEPAEFSDGSIGLLLEPVDFEDPGKALDGVTRYELEEGEFLGEFYVRPGDRSKVDHSVLLQKLDRRQVYEFDPAKPAALRGIRLGPRQSLQGLLTLRGSRHVPHGKTQQFSVLQRQGGEIVGGSTYELRLKRAAGLLPVSRIRVVLEKVEILDDSDPWIKGAGEFHFTACVGFNGDPCRRSYRRVPQRGVYRISDRPGRNVRELDACIFDGYVEESDRMALSILPIEHDWLDPDDELALFYREFDGPPEPWVGSYGPDDERPERDPERLSNWRLWYRIESVRLV